jgi:hypothetical protein
VKLWFSNDWKHNVETLTALYALVLPYFRKLKMWGYHSRVGKSPSSTLSTSRSKSKTRVKTSSKVSKAAALRACYDDARGLLVSDEIAKAESTLVYVLFAILGLSCLGLLMFVAWVFLVLLHIS